MTFYQYPDYMYHHGVKGMKWGVRRKSNKLTKLGRKADLYESKSKLWDITSKNMDKNARELGPVGYGKRYNKIKKAKSNSKQLARYAEHYRKRTESYMHKLSKKYTVKYDVVTKKYSLQLK